MKKELAIVVDKNDKILKHGMYGAMWLHLNMVDPRAAENFLELGGVSERLRLDL